MAHDYVASRDGTPIAYQVRGASEGPALVFTNGYTASDFYWRELLPHFAERCRLVTWDLKGHGASGPAHSPDAVTVEDSVDDLRRVLDAAGVEQAVLVAFSLGCQIILEAWRHWPERIAALVPILGTYGHPFDNLIHPALGPRLMALLEWVGGGIAGAGLHLAGHSYHLPGNVWLNKLAGVIGRDLPSREMKPFFEHMKHIHGPTWAAMGLAAQRHSAEDLLPDIRVPVLVIAGGQDTFTPQRLSEHMADSIPGAEYLLLPRTSHTGLLEVPGPMAERMGYFLEEHGLL